MKRTLVRELPSSVGETVEMEGQLFVVRDKGKILFFVLSDRSGSVQIVVDDVVLQEQMRSIAVGSVLRVTGRVQKSPTELGVEVLATSIDVLQRVTKTPPIVLSKAHLDVDLDTNLTHRVLTLRHPRSQNIFRFASALERELRLFLESEECTQINTPKLIAFPTEGGSEVFAVQYFERTAYLAQSPQFYKQMMVPVLERVYEIGRAYRAEPSSTTRHMSEILMLDVEIGYIRNFEDILTFATRMVQTVTSELQKKESALLQHLHVQPPLVPEHIPRVTLQELHERMYTHTGEDHRSELDAHPSEERFICSYAKEHWQSDFVFITEFPWADAKFYHRQSEQNPEVTDRADLLFRGVEIATLTRREVRPEKLREQMRERGVDPMHPGLTDYLSAFDYGMPEEGGFGLGIARFIQKYLDLANVKEAELFPRDMKRLTP